MDPGVFANVFAGLGWNTAEAFRSSANKDRYAPTAREACQRDSRDTTPDPMDDANDGGTLFEGTDRLQLRFDDGLARKAPAAGWLFGSRARTADVTICTPGTPGVSRQHFSLSITPDLRVQYRQLSAHSTSVVYHAAQGLPQEVHPKQGDVLFVSLAPSEPAHWNKVEVAVGRPSCGVSFSMSFPNHTADATHAYRDNLARWAQGSSASPSGQTPSPPRFGSLCYRKTIGSGAFGDVEFLVDLTTGATAARKRLPKLANQVTASERRRIETDFWSEARLLQKNPHPHLAKLLLIQQDPTPSILMPYYPLGNMRDATLRADQYRSAFRQVLVVLEFLHGRNVAHRDLKPENMLIERLEPLHIVVTDCGLAKEAVPGEPINSFCGTPLYGAPDRVPYERRGSHDTNAETAFWLPADIWSAGLVMLEWTYGWPSTQGMQGLPHRDWIVAWSKAVIETVAQQDRARPGDRVLDILKHMLVMDPLQRYKAADCLARGWANGLFKKTRAGEGVDAGGDGSDGSRAKTTRRPTSVGSRHGTTDAKRPRRRPPQERPKAAEHRVQKQPASFSGKSAGPPKKKW